MNFLYSKRKVFETLKYGGPINLIRFLMFFLRIKNFAEKLKTDSKVSNTSATDSEFMRDYAEVSKFLAQNRFAFNNFRRDINIINAYDHVTYFQAMQYVDIVKRRGHDNLFIKKSNIGKPAFYSFSSTSLKLDTLDCRNTKVVSDLKILFGDSLSKMRLIECGGGFGSLANNITINFPKISKYSIYDLPSVLILSKLYLNTVSKYPFRFLNGQIVKELKGDLFISNYAFCELSREHQDFYLTKVIDNCKHGYITWSPVSEESLGGYSLSEIIRRIKRANIMDERPLTGARNCIIYW